MNIFLPENCIYTWNIYESIVVSFSCKDCMETNQKIAMQQGVECKEGCLFDFFLVGSSQVTWKRAVLQVLQSLRCG
jgi:hypothetical protein